MAKSSTAPIHAQRAAARRSQADAADPAVSAWVSANAGTGKTHVLTTRVLRLMLAGTGPDRILALTYTKAAAAEMSRRVFSMLAEWTTIADAELTTKLTELTGAVPDAAIRQRARTLFAAAIETPGGLKVQTIHSFCERLLQRFPLEAGVSPNFTILDEQGTAALRREAIDDMLRDAVREPKSDLGRALVAAVAYAADDGFDAVLADALSKRDWVEAMVRLEYERLSGLAAARRFYRELAGVRATGDAGSITAEMAALLADAQMARAIEVLAAGKKTDLGLAASLDLARRAATVAERAEHLRDAFMTQAGAPRADTFMTKAIKDAEPGLFSTLAAARDRFARLDEEHAALTLCDATHALLTLADAVLGRYVMLKSRRAALDFDDLIRHVSNLLSRIGDEGRASAAEWVLFKLDGGLDHILVDEAQDTSPAQWAVIRALADEFFAGSGAREEPRTLFAVGDEKQSIYGFQGAEPRRFALMGEQFAGRVRATGQSFRRVSMTLSYRTVAPVLEAVDRVFEPPEFAATLTAAGEPVRHLANRRGHAGLVELWDTEQAVEVPAQSPWSPYGEQTADDPVQRLAARIADTIQRWLATGERLAASDRPVRAGDILVLVRRRRPFAPAMVAALKTRGIAVAGADRLRLTEQIAVRDLIALGDFLVLPEDDLSLATVLKSPLFDFDDDDLMRLAPRRKGLLWTALLAAAETDARDAAAAATLKRWRGQARYMPPFEFFAGLLDEAGGRHRRRLLERLGAEAADPLDEFLARALDYDEQHPPSLQGFLGWLGASTHEIKRDMEQGRDEVRVMTVHGAKGLEAPIVFLPDTCSVRSGGMPGGLIKADAGGHLEGLDAVYFWPVKGSGRTSVITAAKTAAADAESAERNRLLYVAMTRARDRLYVTGYEGKNARKPACWYDMIRSALGPQLTEIATDGGKVWRLERAQVGELEPPPRASPGEASLTPLPPWARTRPAREVRLAVPLAPSRMAPLDTDATGEPVGAPRGSLAEPAPTPPGAMADQYRFLRGTLTHALLEHLPELPQSSWREAALNFVAARGQGLAKAQCDGIVREVLAVLADPAFAPLFGPGSQAEVPIVAEIPRPGGRGPALRLTGQIDRIAVVGSDVFVIDYKTNRPPPLRPDAVADAYLYQLAAYRLALAPIYPGKTVRAAILWTDGPRIMAIPDELLDRYQNGLWKLDPARLDA